MPNTPILRLLVSCRHCHRPVVALAWTAAELTELERHVRRCVPEDLGPSPDIDELLGHFRVVVVPPD
jgi:hypothetical protein